jgi:hypothetical protein
MPCHGEPTKYHADGDFCIGKGVLTSALAHFGGLHENTLDSPPFREKTRKRRQIHPASGVGEPIAQRTDGAFTRNRTDKLQIPLVDFIVDPPTVLWPEIVSNPNADEKTVVRIAIRFCPSHKCGGITLPGLTNTDAHRPMGRIIGMHLIGADIEHALPNGQQSCIHRKPH